MSKNRGVGRDEALSGGFNVRSRAWGPVVLLVVLTIPLASPSALGQGDGWPVLPDPSIEYTPGDLLVLDLGTPVPGQIMGQYVIIEVDDPYGDPLIISSSTVPSGGQNLTLSFTLPSDCEPGAYQVFLCHEGTDGEGELHVGSFTVTLAEESERGPMSILPIVGACLGLLALSVAGAVATGDASKYKFFALVGPLFTRLRKDDVLSHKVRWQILGYVADNVGQNYNQIRRELDLPNGTLAYHLQVLERAERIVCVKDGRYVRFYTPDAFREGVPSRILSDIERGIVVTIKDNPGISQKEIALILDEKPENVGYHLRKMVRAGWLNSSSRGRETHYKLGVVNFEDEIHE